MCIRDRDLKDMILVTENDRGTEINMLMTQDDYKSFIAIDDMSEPVSYTHLGVVYRDVASTGKIVVRGRP